MWPVAQKPRVLSRVDDQGDDPVRRLGVPGGKLWRDELLKPGERLLGRLDSEGTAGEVEVAS